jgi:hypothetical protein
MIGDWPGETEFLRENCTDQELAEAVLWEIVQEETLWDTSMSSTVARRRFKAIKILKHIGLPTSTAYRVLGYVLDQRKAIHGQDEQG